MLAYIKAYRAYVTMGFYDNGHLLRDPDGLLEGTGGMRHVKVRASSEIDSPRFAGWVRDAARMRSEGVPLPGKRTAVKAAAKPSPRPASRARPRTR